MDLNRYKVIKAYESPYPDPIVFHQNERVEVGKEFKDDPDWKDWFWCQSGEKKAWVPRQYIDIGGNTAVFNRDYNALELTVTIDEILTVEETVNGFGLSIKSTGEKGWVPMKNLELLSPEPAFKLQ